MKFGYVLLSVYLATCLTPETAGAENISAAVLVPWTFLKTYAESKLNSSENQPGQAFETHDVALTVNDIPFTIPAIRTASLNSNLYIGASGSTTTWTMDLRQLTIEISDFSIHQQIVRDIGGANVVVHLNASCKGFHITQDFAQLTSRYDWQANNNEFAVNTMGMSLDWAPGSWIVQAPECSGPDGFAAIVQNAIVNRLADTEGLKQFVQPLVQGMISEKLGAILSGIKTGNWFVGEQAQKLSYHRQGTEVIPDKGLLMRFQVSLGDDVPSLNPVLEPLDADILSQVTDQPVLILPKSATQTILKASNLFPKVQTPLNQLSGFSSLLKSRFLQFFIWPELMKFKKTAAFNMTTSLNPSVTEQQRVEFLAAGKIRVQAALSSWIKSERDEQPVNFAYMSTLVNSEVNYSVTNGNLVFKTGKAAVKTQSQYMPEYISKYKPRGGIPSSIINKALAKLVSQRQVEWQAPVLDFNDVVLQISDIKDAGPNHLIFAFQPKR